MLKCLPAFLIFLLFFIRALSVQASLDLPRRMSQRDRVTALEILGPGTSMKGLADPYPLGGYSGLEVGLSNEYINTEDISKLGSKTPDKNDISFWNLSVGKGIYNNVDMIVQFTPPTNDAMTGYAGMVRWSFYQTPQLPSQFSLFAHVSSYNFDNLIVTQTTGAGVLASVSTAHMTFYCGIGNIKSYGTFVGGPDSASGDPSGITEEKQTFNESTAMAQTLVGATFRYNQYFFSGEMQRFTQAFYGVKLGARF
jgi:hypothetical protein